MKPPPGLRHDLASLPDGSALRSVTATASEADGRAGLRVSLTEEVARDGLPGVDYIDQPTMVIIPVDFGTGRIEVDLCAGLTAAAPDYARGFAGLAYHVDAAAAHFECVYLRPLNGARADPPPPRDRRGVQYFSYPDWPFDRLRSDHPDGRYEAAAPIGPDSWHHLALAVGASSITAWVDDHPVLTVQPKSIMKSGAVGLFVDIGTVAWFANLDVRPG